MADYQVIYDSFTVEKTQDGHSAVVKYVDGTKAIAAGACYSSNNFVALPELGDAITDLQGLTAFDINTFSNCVVTRIQGREFAGPTGVPYYLVTYSTDKAQDSYTEENLRIGLEYVEIPSQGDDKTSFNNSQGTYAGAQFKVVPRADYEVTSYHSTLESAATYASGTKYFSTYPGTVLRDTFLDESGSAADGTWLMNGPEIQQIVDRNGDKKWRRTESYSQLIIVKDTSPFYGGWNSVYNRLDKVWDTVDNPAYDLTNQADWPRTMPVI